MLANPLINPMIKASTPPPNARKKNNLAMFEAFIASSC